MIREQRKAPLSTAAVHDPHAREFHGLVARHEHSHFLQQFVTGMFETPNNQIRGAPRIRSTRESGQVSATRKRLAVFIANPKCFRMRIANRVVVPSRQSIRSTIAAPRIAGAAFANEKACLFVCDHVRPRHRRTSLGTAIGLKANNVFAAIGRESTVTIIELE